MKNTGTIIAITLIVVLAGILLSGVGMMGLGGFSMMGGYGGMMNGYGMMGGYGNQFGFNPIGSIISLVLWALIIGGIVLVVVWLVRNGNLSSQTSSGSTIEILKTRYARGEITKDQFDEMKKVLEV